MDLGIDAIIDFQRNGSVVDGTEDDMGRGLAPTPLPQIFSSTDREGTTPADGYTPVAVHSSFNICYLCEEPIVWNPKGIEMF